MCVTKVSEGCGDIRMRVWRVAVVVRRGGDFAKFGVSCYFWRLGGPDRCRYATSEE